MNEQNGLNQNTQTGNNGVISPSINTQPVQGIEPLPVPNVATQNATIQPTTPEAPVSQAQQPQLQPQEQAQSVQQVQQAVQQPVQSNTPQVTEAPEELQMQPVITETTQQAQVTPTLQVPTVKPASTNEPVPPKILPANLVADNSNENIDINPNTPALDPISNNMNNGMMQGQMFSQDMNQNNQFSQQPQIEQSMPQQPNTFSPSGDATQVGFVPASSEMPKKKNIPLIIGIVASVVIVLGLMGYFVIFPFVLKTFFSDPINVYEASINEFYKGISATTNDVIHAKAIYDINLEFDSNIEDLKKFSGYSYGVNFGIDPNKELLQVGYQITNLNNKNEYSYFNYIKDGKEYLKYSNNRGYIYNGTIDLDAETNIFATYRDLFNNTSNLNSDDINYLFEKLSELTKGSIKKDKLSKEDTTLEINGETIKVTNNKYEIDEDTLDDMLDYISEGVKKDSRAMEILDNLLGTEDSDIEDLLDEMFSLTTVTLENDVTLTISIYTYGSKNEIIGFGVEASDKSIELQYYSKDGYFELNGKTSYDNELTGKIDEQTLAVVGRQDDDRTNISVKFNDSEILTLVITKWEDTQKELSYNLKYGEYKINGKLSTKYDINDERLKFTFTGDANTGDEYVRFTLNINEDWTSDVSNINTDNAITLTDDQLRAVQNEFTNSLMETPIGVFFSTTNGDYSSGIGDYYNNGNGNNGFIPDNIVTDNNDDTI